MALDQSRVKKIGLISAVLIPLLLVLGLVIYLVFFVEPPYPAIYYPEEEGAQAVEMIEEVTTDAASEAEVIEEKVEEAVTVDSGSEE